MNGLTIQHVRAELAANPRTDRALDTIGKALLEGLDLPAGLASFQWATLDGDLYGTTQLIGQPIRVRLSHRLAPEQAAQTLFHELAHVVAFVAGEGRGIDPDTGHHGLVFETVTQLLCETFGLPPCRDPLSWPRIAWQSRVSLVGDGWR